MLFDNKANHVRSILAGRHETLAVAESVTAGYIQALLSTATDAMLFFQGGITTYNIHQKVQLLKVDPQEAARMNCVSEHIAVQMSKGVQELFKSGYGLAITGYASPIPEESIKHVFAWVAATRHEEVLFTRLITSTKHTASSVQIDFAEQSLELLAEALAHEKV